ncbi:MAG: hypothetical protein ACJARD_001539 [Alphaproteobacteria bacterium]|jgi:hypothetical protein
MNKPPQNPQSGIKPPKGVSAGSGGVGSLSDNYNMSEINQCFKSDRAFHATISDKEQFTQLLSNIGKIPFTDRGVIAKNMGVIVDLNPRLLQDNNVFRSIIQIIKNIPQKSSEFQELAGKVMLKLRDALIKNRNALNLYHKPMADYSTTIREFLSLVPAKPKSSFFSSFDQDILDFIMGKASKEQREKKNAERDQRIADASKIKKPFDDDDEDDVVSESRMQRLVKMMFSDVMRLEPELVSAVILSLVTQLPHGNMVIEDKVTRNNLMQHLDI